MGLLVAVVRELIGAGELPGSLCAPQATKPQVISVASSSDLSLDSGHRTVILAAAFIAGASIKLGSLRRCLAP